MNFKNIAWFIKAITIIIIIIVIIIIIIINNNNNNNNCDSDSDRDNDNNSNNNNNRTQKQQFSDNLNKENKTFKCERHVSATPVSSSVYGWNYNDEQYIVENQNNNGVILITKKD